MVMLDSNGMISRGSLRPRYCRLVCIDNAGCTFACAGGSFYHQISEVFRWLPKFNQVIIPMPMPIPKQNQIQLQIQIQLSRCDAMQCQCTSSVVFQNCLG